MQKLLLFVDKVSTFVGQTFSWLIVGLTLLISWEVFSRYALDHPHAWAFDAMIMMYGTLFMMAGAYTLAKNSHVRGDVLYGFFPPRTQAGLDLTLYILFFIPGIIAFVWAGYTYAAESWAINEHSNITPEGPPVYPFKTVIPVAGALILVQGIVEIIRCIICLKQGEWPSREEDVEEVDVDKLKEMVHVKDEDIAKLDRSSSNRKQERPANEKGSLVRPLDDGAGGHPGVRPDAAAVTDDQRAPGPADARDDLRGHHAGFSHGVHADGDGRVLRVARLSQRRSDDRGRRSLDLSSSAPTA